MKSYIFTKSNNATIEVLIQYSYNQLEANKYDFAYILSDSKYNCNYEYFKASSISPEIAKRILIKSDIMFFYLEDKLRRLVNFFTKINKNVLFLVNISAWDNYYLGLIKLIKKIPKSFKQHFFLVLMNYRSDFLSKKQYEAYLSCEIYYNYFISKDLLLNCFIINKKRLAFDVNKKQYTLMDVDMKQNDYINQYQQIVDRFNFDN